jgi:uncharacterized protein (TIGR02147 family)
METKNAGAPQLVHYDNYRGYLKDWYQHFKRLNAKVSFRFLSQRTGLKSPNYWKLIMEGERKLSNEMIPRFARTLKLEELESHYFHHLVLMNQAENIQERALHAQHLADLKKRLAPIAVATPDISYFSRWYLPVLKEAALVCKGAAGGVESIRTHLRLGLSATQIEEGLQILVDGDYLRRHPDGTYSENRTLISTGNRVSSALATRYISRMIEESLPALEELRPPEREYGALTLTLAPEAYDKLKELARQFRKEALSLAENGAGKSDDERVVQVNLQIFALTRPQGGTPT